MLLSVHPESQRTMETYKGKDFYRLVFHKEFTKTCDCWASRNCVWSSEICTDFIVPNVNSFSYQESDPVLWSWKPNPHSAESRQSTCFFSWARWGQETGFDLFEGFVREPELVFKVALTYLPAHLAFCVWQGTFWRGMGVGVEPVWLSKLEWQRVSCFLGSLCSN